MTASHPPTSAAPEAPSGGIVVEEARRRRTFAIISHPDAGKTTLTEKLLLYGGALQEAGQVQGKGARRQSTSDFMDIERRRGISVSSTVLRFDYHDVVVNLLDTPGHHDFSEDTLRVLAAADAAVILLDAAKGVEAQTLRLFEVAQARGIPLLVFVNKYDRPGLEPLEMLDHITEVLGIEPVAMTWPVGIPGDFRGVVDRAGGGGFVRFTRTVGGATQAPEEHLDAAAALEREGEAWSTAVEELELLEAVSGELDLERFATGRSSPVYFGSAVSNFGVRLLLDALVTLAPAPRPRAGLDGAERTLDSPFAAQVFKVQANMDPRHRDRVAFLRIWSGRFERGMRAVNARTGKPFTIAHAHEVFGDERAVLDEAFPGDVIGVVNAGDLRVGDTLHADGAPVEFPPIPTLAPERFVRIRNRDTSRHKQFHRGLEQLAQEGVMHVLRRDPVADPTPVLAGIGALQFEVAVERLRTEFGCTVGLDPTPYKVARRTDDAGAEVLRGTSNAEVLHSADGTKLALFTSEFLLALVERNHPDVTLDRMLQR